MAVATAATVAIFSPSHNPTHRHSILPLTSKNRKNGPDLSPDEGNLPDCSAIVPLPLHRRIAALSPLSKDAAMGLTLSAVVGRVWTTRSGIKGPSIPASPTTSDYSL